MKAWIGSDKSFTYDFVYDIASRQEEVYEDTVKPLIEGCFEGKLLWVVNSVSDPDSGVFGS